LALYVVFIEGIRVIYDLKMIDGICKKINGKPFVKSRLKNNLLKNAIYVFRRDGEIVYVGETGRGLYRCIDGLTCSELQSVAYPWRNHRDIRNAEIKLMMIGVGLPSTMAVKRRSREVVESDVTTAIFAETGSWPEKMTSLKIHGGMVRSKTYNSAVQKILNRLKIKRWLRN